MHQLTEYDGIDLFTQLSPLSSKLSADHYTGQGRQKKQYLLHRKRACIIVECGDDALVNAVAPELVRSEGANRACEEFNLSFVCAQLAERATGTTHFIFKKKANTKHSQLSFRLETEVRTNCSRTLRVETNTQKILLVCTCMYLYVLVWCGVVFLETIC